MIKITAVSYNNQASLSPLSAIFGREGGTLGRSTDNYFVLPDPKNLVSRIQASIKSDGLRHTITSLSKANPVLLNGNEIAFDRECVFNAGDELQIGLYILRAEPHLVAVDGATGNLSHAVIQMPPAEAHAAVSKNRPWNPGNTQTNVPSAVRQVPNLADLHQKKSEAATDRTTPSNNEFEFASTSDDDKPANGSSSTDALPLSNDNEILMQAFLKGTGIPPNINLPARLTPELMEMLGKLFAASIQGTFQLLATRASIKREVNAGVTMVVVRNNNPLKFLPDSETVLTQMLRKKMPGFMSPVEAMQDAFADLHAHQSGMVAGMNGAISEVLKRFAPKTLEKRTAAPTFFDSVLPLQRKARMWEQYTSMFDEINREAQHDYQKLFGKAFLKAYEKEIERARKEEQDG